MQRNMSLRHPDYNLNPLNMSSSGSKLNTNSFRKMLEPHDYDDSNSNYDGSYLNLQ